MKPYVANACVFLLARFPFVNALTLLMLLGERASQESYPPIHPKIIYGHLALFVICGALMSSHIKIKSVALVYAGQQLFFAYNLYSSSSLKYGDWLKIRMASRQMGCVGIYVLFAYIAKRKYTEYLHQAALVILGLYAFILIFILNNSKEDLVAFRYHLPLPDLTLYLFMLILGFSALCFFSGYQRFFSVASFLQAACLTIMTALVDCDYSYWTLRKGVHFWNQMRLISDHICIIIGLILYGCTAWKKM